MESVTKPVELPKPQRVARLVLVVALVALGGWILHGFFEALVWAAVIGIALSPLYVRIERRWPRFRKGALLPALTVLVVAAVVLGPIAWGLVRAIAEAQDIKQWFDTAMENGIPVPQWMHQLPFGQDAAVNWWQQHLATPEATRAELARFDQGKLMNHGQNIAKGVIHHSLTFFFMLLALFFVLRDGDTLLVQFRTASHRLFGPSGERIGRQVVQSVRGTIDGLVLVGLGEGAAMTIAYLGFGVPHPILLGIVTAVAAMIPFGAALMYAIAGLLLIGQGSVGSAIAVVAIGFAVVAIADHWLRPVLIGGATRLPFLWVLLGILGGVETLGLLGLFVGPATMAVLVMLWREFVDAPSHPGDAEPV